MNSYLSIYRLLMLSDLVRHHLSQKLTSGQSPKNGFAILSPNGVRMSIIPFLQGSGAMVEEEWNEYKKLRWREPE